MTEQVENNNSEVVENKPQYTEVELKALEMGWRPKDEFDGDEVDFIDAKEFVGRKPLYDKIGQQSKELKAVREAVEALKGHYTKVRETEYKRALNDLKAERKAAFDEGDGEKFNRIDDQIKDTERVVEQLQREAAIPAVKQEPDVHPEFVNWTNKNPWYNSVKYMRDFADSEGLKLAQQGMPRDEVLKAVEKAVRKEFPHKFVNPNKSDAPDVGASKGTPRTGRSSGFEMDDRERKVMNTLVRSGAITEEQYIADLKKVKGIK